MPRHLWAASSANLPGDTDRKPGHLPRMNGAGSLQAGKTADRKPCQGKPCIGCGPPHRSGRSFHLAKLGPACFLSERNSPAPGSRKNALGPALPARIRTPMPSRKLFQNGNSLRKFVNLILRIPAILAEPSQRFSYVCHCQNPLGLLAGSIVVISSDLRYLLNKKIFLSDLEKEPRDGPDGGRPQHRGGSSPEEPKRKKVPTARL